MPRKMGEVIVADLKKGSEKGLELAKHILQEEKIEHPKLREGLEHYIAYWKEFLHPGLFAVACETVGGNPNSVLPTQAAIAMITAAFDMQDDIIDKSTEKNRIATVYGMLGAEMTLLLGNAFLIEGFKLFVDSTAMLSKEKRRNALEKVKKLLFEVGNAHALEVGLKERKNVTPNDYMKITEMKAASVEADMYLGALLGGGKDDEVEALARMGRILGILATFRDDLIDVFDIEELRQRISVQDLPLPLSFAIQEQGNRGKVMKILSKPRLTKSDVAELVDITLVAKPVVKLKNEMKSLIREGSTLTNKLSIIKLRSKLKVILSFMLEDL